MKIYKKKPNTITHEDDNIETNGELKLLTSFIKPGMTVFDIGANVGNWSKEVIKLCNGDVGLYCFEPIPEIFSQLEKNIDKDRYSLSNVAMSNEIGEKEFYNYAKTNDKLSQLSTFYRRSNKIESWLSLKHDVINVKTNTIDNIVEEKNIKIIDYLKIDTEGAELDVINGSLKSLDKIKIIQFEYGGCFEDAGIKCKTIYDILNENGYIIFMISSDGLWKLSEWKKEYENYKYSNLIGVSANYENQFI